MDEDFVLVGDVIRKILEEKQLFPRTLYGAWEEIVGEETAKYSQPRRLVKNVLYVVVTDPVWKHHLELNKSEILEKLNQFRPEKPIENIRFRIGEIKTDVRRFEKPKGRKRRRSGYRSKKKVSVRKLTGEDKEVLKKISDVELRKICRSLLKRVR